MYHCIVSQTATSTRGACLEGVKFCQQAGQAANCSSYIAHTVVVSTSASDFTLSIVCACSPFRDDIAACCSCAACDTLVLLGCPGRIHVYTQRYPWRGGATEQTFRATGA
jgi:hypothetical protein